jgi:hypothetical protein
MECPESLELKPALTNFSHILEERILLSGASFQANCLSEDTVCLFLAIGFLQAGIAPHRIEMEVPHPGLNKPKGMQMCVDIRVGDNTRNMWVEVKFDRKSRQGGHLNETNRFGNLLGDLLRVGLLPASEGIVLYLTDSVMANYLKNNQTRFCERAPLAIDEAFLKQLPASAALRINARVRSFLGNRTFHFQLVWQRTFGALEGFAWQTCTPH